MSNPGQLQDMIDAQMRTLEKIQTAFDRLHECAAGVSEMWEGDAAEVHRQREASLCRGASDACMQYRERLGRLADPR